MLYELCIMNISRAWFHLHRNKLMYTKLSQKFQSFPLKNAWLFNVGFHRKENVEELSYSWFSHLQSSRYHNNSGSWMHSRLVGVNPGRVQPSGKPCWWPHTCGWGTDPPPGGRGTWEPGIELAKNLVGLLHTMALVVLSCL